MMDIDWFKQCNDRHGHDAGDEVLKQIADCLARGSRAGDLVCRIGGEEFLVLCPNTSIDEARAAAERSREAVAAASVAVADTELHITMSVGVAARDQRTQTFEHLLKCADEALYLAKRDGRNCVRVYEPSAVVLEEIPV